MLKTIKSTYVALEKKTFPCYSNQVRALEGTNKFSSTYSQTRILIMLKFNLVLRARIVNHPSDDPNILLVADD